MNAQTPDKAQTFPAIARWLGYGGIIPFAALAISIVAGVDLSRFGIADAAVGLCGYAAVIISFIGAVHWGVAMQMHGGKQQALFVYGVVPALVGWMWLLLPASFALYAMAVTVALLYMFDRILLSALVPEAYLKMRLHLSVVVSLCLLLAAFRTA